jgi:hypothetical protein
MVRRTSQPPSYINGPCRNLIQHLSRLLKHLFDTPSQRFFLLDRLRPYVSLSAATRCVIELDFRRGSVSPAILANFNLHKAFDGEALIAKTLVVAV